MSDDYVSDGLHVHYIGSTKPVKYPDEFLGRCATCLDNALLSSKPCVLGRDCGYAQGHPLNDDECLIRRARRAYDAETAGEQKV